VRAAEFHSVRWPVRKALVYVALAGALHSIAERAGIKRAALDPEAFAHGRGSHFCVGYSSRFPELVANKEEVNLVVYDAGLLRNAENLFKKI
jgi:hypothetical protein